jgi:hypothetical protein
MKIIKIDPNTETVEVVELPGQVTHREICAFWDNRPMTCAGRFPTGDYLWVDDEGLLYGPANFFSLQALNQQPLSGIGVITGPEEGGEYGEDIVDVKIDVETVRKLVIFLGRMARTGETITEMSTPGMFHIHVAAKIEPQ